MLDGALTGKLDTRLEYYKTNQSRIPSITGKVIPEAVFSKRNYLNTIYEKIKTDIAPFDTQNILNPIWVNSRGAIPRFDRGSIEIRVMDIQECLSLMHSLRHDVRGRLHRAGTNELMEWQKLEPETIDIELGLGGAAADLCGTVRNLERLENMQNLQKLQALIERLSKLRSSMS